MPAAYQDLNLEQGTTFTEQITLTDQYGASYNLYNFSIASQARKSYFSANASIIFNASVYDAPNGIIQLTVDAPTLANVSAGKYVYDVKITDSASHNVTRVLEGQVFVSPDVTR